MLEKPILDERDETFHRTKSIGQTILVAEDFDDTRFMIKLSLELNGYRVLEARMDRKQSTLPGGSRWI